MNKYVLTVTLNPAIDKTTAIPNFKAGKDFRSQETYLSAGGKGVNVSRVLKSLKTPTIATGFLGGANGIYIQKQLKKEKIRSNFTTTLGNTRINLTILDPKTTLLTRILEPGPKVSKKEITLFLQIYKKLLTKSQYVILSGKNLPQTNINLYANLIQIAKEKNVFVAFDTSDKELVSGIKQKPWMVKPNLEEAQYLLKKKINSLPEIKNAAYTLYKKGVSITAITLGSKGAVVFDGNEMIFAQPPKITRINPVGCGDAFLAGFIHTHRKTHSLLPCTQIAVACGAANALTTTPGLVNPNEVTKLLQQIKIKIF